MITCLKLKAKHLPCNTPTNGAAAMVSEAGQNRRVSLISNIPESKEAKYSMLLQ